jgi:membrane-bound metal-dependent hydrolase YbcI (DUF457 family)
MLVLGHTGITLGAATLLAGASNYKQTGESWFTRLSRYVDIRFLLVGSLLPDIIDKPVGQYFFRETFNNGRIFSHTLIFLIVIAAVGFYIFKHHRQVWMLSLAVGTLMHLVLDEMWNTPATLFWPLTGVNFPAVGLTGWAAGIIEALFSEPAVYIPEAVGLVILLWFSAILIRKREFGAFIKSGKVL